MATNWNLLGHEWAVELLRQHIANGSPRHAYLFTGPAGVGRKTLALRFAQALNCAVPIAPGEPCEACWDCTHTQSEKHPDLTVLQAEDKQQRPAEGGSLLIKQVRDLRSSMHLNPFTARHRIFLYLRFHEATDEASNALLKTLEEAPTHAILLITANTVEGLLPTVVSRCDVLRLRPMPISSLASGLEQSGLETRRAQLVAHLSGGRAGYALRLAADATLLEARATRLDDLQVLLPSSRAGKFAYAEKLSKDKAALRQTLLEWLSYWRDILLRVTGTEAAITNVDRSAEIEALSQRLELAGTRRFVRRLERSLEQLERSVNPRLLTEALLLAMPR